MAAMSERDTPVSFLPSRRGGVYERAKCVPSTRVSVEERRQPLPPAVTAVSSPMPLITPGAEGVNLRASLSMSLSSPTRFSFIRPRRSQPFA